MENKTKTAYVIAAGKERRWQNTTAKTLLAAKRAASALAGSPRQSARVGELVADGVVTVAIRFATYKGQRPASWE